MDKITLAKNITKLVVGASVSYVVRSAIRNNTNPNTHFQKAEVIIGAIVITMVLDEVTDNYIDRKINQIVQWHRENNQKENELT